MLYLYIIFGLLFCLSLFLIFKTEYENDGSVFFILLFPLFFMCEGIFSDTQPTTLIEEKVEIVSLERGSSMSGSFFLGIGGMGSSQKYYFYRKLKDGTFLLDSVDAENTPLQESNEKPVLVKIKRKWGECKNALYCTKGKGEISHFAKSYKLIVPKGTILREFKVN